MKILIEVPDRKAPPFLEVLRSIPFVKATLVTEPKTQLVREIRASVEEMQRIRAGKKKARSAASFLHGL